MVKSDSNSENHPMDQQWGGGEPHADCSDCGEYVRTHPVRVDGEIRMLCNRCAEVA